MERIGRYEILEEIGRGGFGRVYRATDPLMKSEVAIKVISTADDPEMLARFRGEAAAARMLRHESIVTIYDVGEHQGVPYIVMEYLQGMDLQKIRDQRRTLPLVEKVRILSQVAAGLQIAHENGIIHRDVKPANIMVLRDGSVKIMDFGIARATRDGSTHLTRTGVVVGTLQYIPPEQFEGHAADALADLWAFGVIAFQLFSGKNPFEAAETMQVIYNITSLPIPDLRQLNPELPAELCQMVGKLLQRDRSARYQSFEDVRIDLNPVLESLGAEEANRLVDDARMMAARGDLPGAHKIVRQVLERYPSNTTAKQIRDHIITQIRASEASRQVGELLKKGDQDLSAGKYEDALASYGQACKLDPNSSTARLRWERAQQMAERARRVREAMNQARSRLAAGSARDAEVILAGILAEEAENAEALTLRAQAEQQRAHQDEAARADAILYSRHLVAQRRYAQALAVLDDCARQVGDHADLGRAMEEVRRAELAETTRVRVEEAIARANQHVRNGDYDGATAVLAPLAAEFPADADIRELLKYIAEEEARARRVAEQRAAQERSAAPPPSGAVPAMKLDRATVIQRALEMSRERERNGQVSEAIHILEVALSRFPDAQDLENERLRLSMPKAPRIEWAPDMAPKPAAPAAAPIRPPVWEPAPLPAEGPSPRPAPGRRTLWLLVLGVGTACAGLLYWQLAKPCGFGKPCAPVSPAGASEPRAAGRGTRAVRARRAGDHWSGVEAGRAHASQDCARGCPRARSEGGRLSGVTASAPGAFLLPERRPQAGSGDSGREPVAAQGGGAGARSLGVGRSRQRAHSPGPEVRCHGTGAGGIPPNRAGYLESGSGAARCFPFGVGRGDLRHDAACCAGHCSAAAAGPTGSQVGGPGTRGGPRREEAVQRAETRDGELVRHPGCGSAACAG